MGGGDYACAAWHCRYRLRVNKEQGSQSPWPRAVGQVAAILRIGLAQFVGFELLFRLLAAVVFTPLTAWLATSLIRWSGSGSISNYDIASFFLSPKGILFATVTATIGFATAFFEFGGLIALAGATIRRKNLSLPQLFKFLISRLRQLWILSVRQFFTYVVVGLPSLVVVAGAYSVFLTSNDINYFLQTKPPAFWYAVTISVIAGGVFAFLAIRLFIGWIYSLPLLLFGGRSPKEALRESEEMVHGRRREVLMMLLRWLMAVVSLALVAGVVMGVVETIFFKMAGTRVGLVLGMVAFFSVLHLLVSILMGVVGSSTLACAVARRFFQARPDIRLPSSLVNENAVLVQKALHCLRATWVVVLLVGGATTYVAIQMINKIEFRDSVAITAHRGSSITAPENTMAAFQLAIDEGTDYIELDVLETKDGVIAIVHDKDLKRVTGLDKGIWEVTYDEIKDLDIGTWFDPKFADQRIPTLQDAIALVKGKCKLNIELKFHGHEQNFIPEVIRIVKESNFLDQCVMTSLEYAGLVEVERLEPAVVTGAIVTAALGDVTTKGSDFLSLGAAKITRDMVHRAHDAGKEVHVWTVNEPSVMNTMIGIGVDNIITDSPGVLRNLIEERRKLSNVEKALLQIGDFAAGRVSRSFGEVEAN
jgi:glycerophosphoryl diester phosphodiesterase